MISAYTGTQIRAAEQQLLSRVPDPGMGAVLMQRAAYGLANAVVRELRARGRRLYGASVVVLAGKGNNGGDGLFAAALLARRGLRTTAVLTAGARPSRRAGGVPRRRRPGAPSSTDGNAAELAATPPGADVVIDAVLGTGAQGGLRGRGRRAGRSAAARPRHGWWWPATSPAVSTPTPARRTRPSSPRT